MKFQKNTRSDPGFTLIELIVVLALATIVMGIALPSLLAWLPTYRLSAGARQVASDLQLARMKAISQNAKFRLRFTAATTYEFQKESGGTFIIDSGPFGLPDGITVTGATPFNTSEFQPRGTADAAGSITLENSNSLNKTVDVSIVGRVSIQ